MVHTYVLFISQMSSMVHHESLPSGERLHSAMEHHLIFNGKIHELSMAIFNCKLLVHQRVNPIKSH